MPRKRPICADCGKKLEGFEADLSYFQGRCQDCRENYEGCRRCGELRRLEDMRQSHCVDSRRECTTAIAGLVNVPLEEPELTGWPQERPTYSREAKGERACLV
jgi:hypothetical protein